LKTVRTDFNKVVGETILIISECSFKTEDKYLLGKFQRVLDNLNMLVKAESYE